MNKQNILQLVCSITLILALFALPGSAASEVKASDSELMPRLFSLAESELGELEAENTLIITDLGSSEGSYIYQDAFYKEFFERKLSSTKNLLKVQNSKNSPFWFAFFNKASGNCSFIEINLGAKPELSAPVTRNIAFEKLYSNQTAWTEEVNQKVFKGREFAIVTLANGWVEGLDYELIRCLETHNHFCPGVSSGYVLAKWMEENYPLSEGEQYLVFSCPTWCKEDVFVRLWDATPGKRGLWASELRAEEIEALGGAPAGIFVVWNGKEGKGKAVALNFDFDKVRESCGSKAEDAGWASKYLMDVWLLDDKNWKGLVSEAAVLEIDEATLAELKLADSNPYVTLGLLNPPEKSKPLENANPSEKASTGFFAWLNQLKEN
ncbi:MAG: FmdE family protein [Methanosarcinaceae archaeon]|nr:FmdE family protein [Methanosarcinaceae archaeon]MDD4332408.1 FmdE family protein [Methanosarcinaceae archaeon]MDD4750004.1 FmdE family protein [Methanosarcinaceae archaeon]